MSPSALPRTAPRIGMLVGGTLLGWVLVVAGLLAAYATVATPLVSKLVPDGPAGGGQLAVGFGVWSFALIAGGAMLLSGTSRLAFVLMTLKSPVGVRGPAARGLASMPDDVVVVSDVVPGEGLPIPELVIGAFGVAVIHALPTSSRNGHGRLGRGPRTNDGSQPGEELLAAAIHDADRVRRWVSEADLDFVVRVYAALVVGDRTIERSPTCAVIGAQQIPAWIASLPRQRTLTAGRRGRLLAMAQPSAGTHAASRNQKTW